MDENLAEFLQKLLVVSAHCELLIIIHDHLVIAMEPLLQLFYLLNINNS